MYKFKQLKREDFEKNDPVDIFILLIEIFNLAGFRFSSTSSRPDIQKFIDRYPHLIEHTEEEF